MKHLLHLSALGLLLASCSDRGRPVDVRQQLKQDSSTPAAAIVFDKPRPLDSSGIVVYPLLLERGNAGGFYKSYGGGARSSYWNLLFYDLNSGSRHLLSEDRKLIITSIQTDYYSGNNAAGAIREHKDWIFYQALADDFNADGRVDDNDPGYLFVSGRDGRGFRQLSPSGKGLVSWELVTGTSKVLMQVRSDDNGDKVFDEQDSDMPYIVDLTNGIPAAPAFAPPYLDSLYASLRKQWK